MKRYLLIVLLILISAGSFFLNYFQWKLRIEPTQAESKIALINQDELSSIVNKWRYENGLQPFSKNEKLCELASQRSSEIITNWSHDGFRAESSKIAPISTTPTNFGENLSQGYWIPQEALNAWINSPEHLKNLKNPTYTQMCIVCTNNYCAQELSTSF